GNFRRDAGRSRPGVASDWSFREDSHLEAQDEVDGDSADDEEGHDSANPFRADVAALVAPGIALGPALRSCNRFSGHKQRQIAFRDPVEATARRISNGPGKG